MKGYDPCKAKRILECADSYLKNADRLIYSYGSKTFLSGYDVFDARHEMRGNIDCSTFVILALSGIPYEESPYAESPGAQISLRPAGWAEQDLADFDNLPERFVGIAERIGRPYLAGPKGLDLIRAEELGIGIKTLEAEIRAVGTVRRSVALAAYYRKKDACFTDPSLVKPGDLVFFCSKGYFSEKDRRYQVKAEINHVGIITEDTGIMIASSGSRDKFGIQEDAMPAVAKVPVFGEREPYLFARAAAKTD